ncbi:PREDICTED: uncharacterized protein LOC105147241 [Acromyrmex echinatior]|uniref:Uncharacterized protein C16orf48-like protein n=1 Tax=Acromyrmex echinatior TaxID=103372 RepID=F4WNE4_ACREC|nr:PREDICTED: uncharacterized protein LOC105147241 [Acromyrmex echinatior]EGI64314.1 Uncharacterized protein C16orf48-like protein [Acromyrmex echinatior]
MKVTTLKGIFPDPKPVRRKNFIQENVKNLRRMEQCFQANKELEELEKLQLHKHHRNTDKYQNVSAKVVTTFRDKKKHESYFNVEQVSNDKEGIDEDREQAQNRTNVFEYDKKHVVSTTKKVIGPGMNNNMLNKQKRTGKNQQRLQPKVSSEPNVLHKSDSAANGLECLDTQSTVKYRNQGIQTLDTDQLESIYSEGIIRYPSKKITKHKIANNGDLNKQEEKNSRKQSDSPADRGDMHDSEDLQKADLRNSMSPASKEEVDFIKLNKERTSVANKLMTQLNNGVPSPNYRKGVLPKYLRDRKEAQEKEQKAKAEALHSDCPEGHVPLPDHERKETLRLLKKNYQEYVNELNMMPIKTDTLRAQRRKIEIEKQLNKLEEGIKVFSRPKVYVKINA